METICLQQNHTTCLSNPSPGKSRYSKLAEPPSPASHTAQRFTTHILGSQPTPPSRRLDVPHQTKTDSPAPVPRRAQSPYMLVRASNHHPPPKETQKKRIIQKRKGRKTKTAINTVPTPRKESSCGPKYGHVSSMSHHPKLLCNQSPITRTPLPRNEQDKDVCTLYGVLCTEEPRGGQEQRLPLFRSVSSPTAVHRDELLPLALSAKRPPKAETKTHKNAQTLCWPVVLSTADKNARLGH